MARFVDPTIIGDDKWNDLNDAAIQGLGQFLSDIEHDPNDSEHRIWASESVGDLYDGIRGNTYPNYDDDYIAAAYMVEYHLSHCALAYWAFSGLLNGMNRLPDALYQFRMKSPCSVQPGAMDSRFRGNDGRSLPQRFTA